MFGSGDSGGEIFGNSGLFGGQSGGAQQKEFGSSSATAAIGGDTVGLQLDWKILAVAGAALVLLTLGAVWLISKTR